ncbi:hypothetical protein P8935_02455 [Telmatobacter sp. DSM 110680]|uniref:Lipoprotein n=1 Tax=Telmatobacter sp. DSM 110680 TaxID=3036704 RepID=A0AAU7DJD6_9BACT
MKLRNQALCKGSPLFVLSLAIVCVAGCKTHSAAKVEAAKTESTVKSAPVGGTYCLQTYAQGTPPTKTVHFSYKESESDGTLKDYEGDLVGDNLDSTVHEKRPANDTDREMASDKRFPGPPIVDGFVDTNRSLHSTRSDISGWSMGSSGQVQAFTPWGLFIAKPVVTQVGTENVAGSEALKYSVDSSQQSQLEKMPLTFAGGLKDYTIKGTAWVDPKQQCILQYDINYEEVAKDGTVKKTHYEGSTARQ